MHNKLFKLLIPSIIFIIAFLQYANTIDHDYAWDDKLVITGNPYTVKGMEGLGEIFSNRVSVPNKNVYRPVPQAMFAIEYDLFEQKPAASHFFSILWYAVLCVVIYYFIRYLFPQSHSLFACMVALLFAVHPLHVEVVANIKSRDETLALLFGLCAIMAFVQAILKKTWWLLVPGIILFALAVLSKENVVTLLPIVLLAAWYRSDNFKVRRGMVAGSLLFIAGAAIVYWINHGINPEENANSLQLNATVLNNEFLWTKSPEMIYPTSIANIGRYLKLFIFPHPLIHLYGYNQIPFSGWFSINTLLVLALLIFTARYLIFNFRKKTPAVFGIVFFICTYSMYSNFFVLAPDTMADRYLFFPSLGLSIIVVELLFYLAGLSIFRPSLSSLRPRIVAVISVLILMSYFIRTFIGNRDWKNDTTLTYNRMPYMQNNAAAQATYGLMLYRESNLVTNPDDKFSKKLEAMNAFMKSLEIYPDFYWSWISVGKIFADQGMYQKAELAFLKAQQLEPISTDGYFCLGSLYYTLGDNEPAISYLEKAVLLDPEIEQSYVMLGKAYLQANSIDNLGSLAKTCTVKFSQNAEFDALMATYYFRNNLFKEAAVYVKSTLRKDPRNMMALLLQENLRNVSTTNY
ncbi:MAG: glycosyltransferase family 39 protein [Flavitalea sp.]